MLATNKKTDTQSVKTNKAVIKHNSWHIKKAKTYYQAKDELDVQQNLPPIDQSETNLCTALWRSVLMQALVDLATNSTKPDYLKIKAEAMQWFYEGFNNEQSDFKDVCYLADLEPEYVKKHLSEMIKTKSFDKIDFRCLRKTAPEKRHLKAEA